MGGRERCVRPRRGRGLKGRCLLFAEREQIAMSDAAGVSVRAIAAQLSDKSVVLTPQVVSFFLDRMSASAVANAAAVRPAIDSARAGRLDQAVQALKGAGDDQLAAVFLKGLALLSAGDLNAAIDKFRDALRLDSEFLPAAFYLGACYAAGATIAKRPAPGRPRSSPSRHAPFVYTLLGDALLRLSDVDQAIDVLTEARTLWPADDRSRPRRLATALVMREQAGGRHEGAAALPRRPPRGSRRPAGRDARPLRGAQRRTHDRDCADADSARFIRYADAYAAAKGPQQALVDQWRNPSKISVSTVEFNYPAGPAV